MSAVVVLRLTKVVLVLMLAFGFLSLQVQAPSFLRRGKISLQKRFSTLLCNCHVVGGQCRADRSLELHDGLIKIGSGLQLATSGSSEVVLTLKYQEERRCAG